jgi:hypothetical protein
MILKYQLYPWTHVDLAKRVASELGLPVDAPRALSDGTMDRFMNWHEKSCELEREFKGNLGGTPRCQWFTRYLYKDVLSV